MSSRRSRPPISIRRAKRVYIDAPKAIIEQTVEDMLPTPGGFSYSLDYPGFFCVLDDMPNTVVATRESAYCVENYIRAKNTLDALREPPSSAWCMVGETGLTAGEVAIISIRGETVTQ